MTETQYEEWVTCGRLPRDCKGKVNLYIIERALRDESETSRRVALLKRVLEARK